MNKAAKASIAAGIAGLLLLGSGGTWAIWQDSKGVDAGQVSTGQLKLTLGSSGTWKDISAGVAGAPSIDPATFKLVPGDTVKFTQKITVNATGNNLKGSVGIDQSSLQAAIPEAWKPYVSVSVAPENLPSGVTQENGTLQIAAQGNYSFDVGVTVAFARGTTGSAVDDELIEGQTATLGALAVTLQQVR